MMTNEERPPFLGGRFISEHWKALVSGGWWLTVEWAESAPKSTARADVSAHAEGKFVVRDTECSLGSTQAACAKVVRYGLASGA